ncbi:putative cyclic pyranopterin monophosphate synthase [groundwater metagenome]|uniref:GTP 3',8-cyclase n=1 Tax=groundwater metagenome TaxID=717931 RepID=A0A098EB74_9ZZZZ
MVKDTCGREITLMRLSVTQKCNLNCPYCHKEGEDDKNKGDKEISVSEIKGIMRAASELGIKKVKITGGEPLLRNDIVEIVKEISKIESIKDISMTTNGFFTDKFAYDLKNNGLNRVNIGCDSLSSSILPKNIKNVEKGLKSAADAGLNPLKINMVVLKGINENEISKMTEISKKYNAILQLIELIPTDKIFFDKFFFSLEGIEKEFERKASSVFVRDVNFRKQYFVDGAVVEVVRAHLNRNFCKNCRRIRVTSNGFVKSCLMRNDNLVKINFNSDEEIMKSLLEGINKREIYYG